MAKLLEITGKAISGEWGQDDDSGTGIPVLRTTNFTNEGFVNYKNVVTRSISKKNIAEKYLRHGDIIIEKSGGSDKQPVGRVIFFEGEENKYLFNNFTGLLRVQNPEEWLPKYVFYALYAYYRNGGTRAFENRTTGLHNLQVDNYVKSADIPKLSYRKQQHICETLDHVRDAIAYREQQLSKLDELIKARFVEMFGGYEPNAKLSDVASITGGLTKNSNRNKMKLKLPYLRVANVSYAKIDVSEMLEIGLTEDEKAKTLLSYDDLLFVEGNGSPDQIGRVALWKNEITPCVHQNHLIKARFNSHLIVPYFALHYFMSQEGREQIQGKAVSTSGLYTLSVSKISNLLIPTPPLSLQNQFAAFVAEVDKSKVEVQKALDQTQLLFDSLMQQYFG